MVPSQRLRLGLLWSSRWLRKACRRTNLPLPVTLNRLAAALRVLSFGIAIGAGTNKQSTTRLNLSPSPI